MNTLTTDSGDGISDYLRLLTIPVMAIAELLVEDARHHRRLAAVEVALADGDEWNSNTLKLHVDILEPVLTMLGVPPDATLDNPEHGYCREWCEEPWWEVYRPSPLRPKPLPEITIDLALGYIAWVLHSVHPNEYPLVNTSFVKWHQAGSENDDS